jgi:hypothetical protein
MGLFDSITSKAAKVVLIMQADTKDAEKNLETLKGREREVAEQAVATQKSINDGLSSSAKQLLEVGVAWGAVQTGIQFASSAWEEYADFADKAGGADKRRADEFRKSLDDWRDSMKQVQIAIGEMVTSFAPAIESLSKVVSLSAQAIAMQNNPGKFFGDDAGKVLDYASWVNPVTAPWKVGGAALGGVGDQFTSSAGTMPSLSDYVGPQGAWWGRQAIDNATPVRTNSDAYARYQQRQRFDPLAKQADGLLAQSDFTDSLLAGFGLTQSDVDKARLKAAHGGGGKGDPGKPAYFIQAENGGGVIPVFVGTIGTFSDAGRAAAGGFGTLGIGGSPLGAGLGYGPSTAQLGASIDAATYQRKVDEYQQQLAYSTGISANVSKRESLLSKTFGPLEEFNAYQRAFGALSSAVGSAFDAMVAGHGGVGKAAKAAIAESLLATGKDAAVHALIETAYGFGSLAIGGPLAGASAAAHFKSAGLFALGAAAAGVAAHELGAGGAGGGGGAPSVAGGGGGASPRGGDQITIYQGDYFSDSNPRRQNVNIGRAVRSAKRELEQARGVSDG